MTHHDPSTPAWLPWAQLTRLPNLFTALADISMGYLVADGPRIRPAVWGGLLLATACLYSAGMVLNDLFDVEVDQRERPERPLPSGRIRRQAAQRLGWGLICGGVIAATVLQSMSSGGGPVWFQPGTIALGLAACIVGYNGWFKSTPLGPLFMGLCRGLNLLMAISVSQDPQLLQPGAWLLIPAGYTCYVMGVTWFARDEAAESRRVTLAGGLLQMLLGIGMLTLLAMRDGFPRERVEFQGPWIWPLLLWLLTAPVWRHAAKALYSASPSAVQLTIKQALQTLIVLDAAIALVVAGPWFAVAILLLSVPAQLLARRVYVT